MNLWIAVQDLVFPPKCPYCQRVLDDPRAPLCSACQPKLPWLMGERGERKLDGVAGCVSPLAYRGPVREAVHRMKFDRVRAYDQPFAQLMAQCVRDHWRELPQEVTWVPLSKKRLRERGFDQARLLAQRVGERLSLPVSPTLEKCRHTQPQSELETDKSRRDNARDAYRLLPGVSPEGKRFLLVDDVVTTGSTLRECAKILRQGGAQGVWCVTLAKARGD